MVTPRKTEPLPGKPHDRLVRAVFEREDDARAVLSLLLPAPILAQLDLASLRPERESLVEDHLKGRFSDLVLRARTRSGQDARLYLLVEHFRDPPARLPLVILGCVARLLRQLDRTSSRSKEPLPRVRAVVIHQADRPYRGPRRVEDLFPNDPGGELLDGVPRLGIAHVDLATIPDERIGALTARAAFAAAALLLLKHAGKSDLSSRLVRWRPSFQAVLVLRNARRALSLLLSFLFAAARDRRVTEVFETTVAEVSPMYMTLADEVLMKGQRENILQFLEARFGPVPDAIRSSLQRVRRRGPLSALVTKAATAKDLGEFAAALPAPRVRGRARSGRARAARSEKRSRRSGNALRRET